MREKKKKGGGKKCYLPIMVLVLAMAVAGCSTLQKQPTDQFSYVSYGVIVSAISTLDVIDSVFYDLRAQRQVSDEAWKKYDDVSNKVVQAIAKAATGMAQYKKGVTSQDKVQAMLDLLSAAVLELEKYYMTSIPVENQKPLIR